VSPLLCHMHGWISSLLEIFPAWGGWREIWTPTGLCRCFLSSIGHSFARLSELWLLKCCCNILFLIWIDLSKSCSVHLHFWAHKTWSLLCQLNPSHISIPISLRSVTLCMTFTVNMLILNFLRHIWVGNILPLHLVMQSNSYVKLSIVSPRREEKPTRCHWMFYCTYNMLNMFRALLCPSSGAREYMCVITSFGVQCLVAGCRGSVAGQQAKCPGKGDVERCEHSTSWLRSLLPWPRPPTTSNQGLPTRGGNNKRIVLNSWWWHPLQNRVTFYCSTLFNIPEDINLQ
jgi:hypothetical protein